MSIFRVEFYEEARKARVCLNGSYTGELSAGFHLDSESIEGTLFQHLADHELDLIEIAMQVYVADRICVRPSRSRGQHQQRWGRDLSVSMLVREPSYWSQPEHNNRLEQLLEYLTGDCWQLSYSRANAQARHEQQFLEFRRPNPQAVCLFSGGLDSLAGVAGLLRESNDSLLMISGCSAARPTAELRKLISALGHSNRIEWLTVRYHLTDKPRKLREESSQRARCLPAFVTAAVVSNRVRCGRVGVMENGIGAINLPYIASQLGLDGTRSTHPDFLWRLSEWLSAHLSNGVKLALQYPFQTKGQMCVHLDNEKFRDLVALSYSCDRHGTIRKTDAKHCGLCTSCLLRRQALFSAGIRGDRSYEFDIFRDNPAERQLAGLVPFQAMCIQAERIRRAVISGGSFFSLEKTFPELFLARLGLSRSLGLNSEVIDQGLLDMYTTYNGEWLRFEGQCLVGHHWREIKIVA